MGLFNCEKKSSVKMGLLIVANYGSNVENGASNCGI
jgi:hypothetical protein